MFLFHSFVDFDLFLEYYCYIRIFTIEGLVVSAGNILKSTYELLEVTYE